MKKIVNVVGKSKRFVGRLFRTKLPGWIRYHSIAHTRDVVRASKAIGEESGLTKNEMEILLVAAWFHDVGYTEKAEGHEQVSVAIAEDFLNAEGYSAKRIREIRRCIMATRMKARSRSRLGKMLTDADLNSLGRRTFFRQNELLRQEMERRRGKRISEKTWLIRSLQFLGHHRFKSPTGKRLLEPGRLRNITSVKRIVDGM